jgi:1-phosphatidylinositol phosphodiesterase
MAQPRGLDGNCLRRRDHPSTIFKPQKPSLGLNRPFPYNIGHFKMLAPLVAQAFTILSLSLSALASPTLPRSGRSLADLALQKVLADASPIFGYFTKNSTQYSSWMSKYPDSTLLVHMNIPGAHDPQTWNYSLATQESLNHVTNLDGNPPFPPEVYRCQEKSFIDMLNAGIRVFDIRYAFDVSYSSLANEHLELHSNQSSLINWSIC